MRRAQITLRLLVAAVLACGLLGGLAGSATAQDEPVQVTVYKLFCEDKNRVGQTDFLVGTAPFELEASSLTGAQAFQESDTSVDCTEEVPDDEPLPSFTLTNVDDPEDSDTQTVDPVTGTAVFAEVEPGTYELSEEDGPTSEPFTVEAGDEQLDITVINFVEESDEEVPPLDQPMQVEVAKKFCIDGGRVGNVDIFVQKQDVVLPAATADDCRAAEEGEVSFRLTSEDDSEIFYEGETDEDGMVVFKEFMPGSYTLEETVTETDASAESEPFDILGSLEETPARIDVVNYLGIPATDTPTPTNTPDPTDAPKPTKTPEPTDAPKATKTPVSGSGGQTPKPTKTPTSGGGGGGVVNPTVVTTRTPVSVATTTTRAVSTTASVRTGAVVRSSPVSVTALPSTGEGSVDVAPLSTMTLMLLGALTLIALGVSMFRRRAG